MFKVIQQIKSYKNCYNNYRICEVASHIRLANIKYESSEVQLEFFYDDDIED